MWEPTINGWGSVSLITPMPKLAVEAVQFRFELGPEIAVFDIVDGPLDTCAVAYGHAAAAGAQVGVVIRAVVKFRNAVRC